MLRDEHDPVVPSVEDFSQRASVLMYIQNMLNEEKSMEHCSHPPTEPFISSLTPFFGSVDDSSTDDIRRNSVIMDPVDFSQRASVLMYIQHMLHEDNNSTKVEESTANLDILNTKNTTNTNIVFFIYKKFVKLIGNWIINIYSTFDYAFLSIFRKKMLRSNNQQEVHPTL